MGFDVGEWTELLNKGTKSNSRFDPHLNSFHCDFQTHMLVIWAISSHLVISIWSFKSVSVIQREADSLWDIWGVSEAQKKQAQQTSSILFHSDSKIELSNKILTHFLFHYSLMIFHFYFSLPLRVEFCFWRLQNITHGGLIDELPDFTEKQNKNV